ncbi:MAG: hypothetical protein ABI837_05730 [Acidobacteriota bacterium]
MSGEDRHIARGLFALLFFAYAYFFGGCGFNQNATFDLTRALVEQHTIAIDRYAGNTDDVSFHAGHTYVNKAPGLSFLAAVPYALMPRPQSILATNLSLYICTVAICGTSGALTAVLLFAIALRMGRTRRQALTLALLAGLATPILPWSTLLFAHVPSTFLILASFSLVSGLGPRRPMLAGAAIGLAATMNYLCIVVALILGLLLLATSKRRLDEGWRYTLGGLPFAMGLMAYQHAAFGSAFRTAVEVMDPRYITRGAFLGILQLPTWTALWGITFSPYRGLFYLCPLLLIAIPGALLMRRRREWRLPFAAIAMTSLFFLVFTAGFNGWYGGWAIGPRYLLPVVPLLMVVMVAAMHRLRALWVATALVSLFLNVAVTAVDPQPPEGIVEPIAHYELPALFTGRPANRLDVPEWLRRYYTGHTSISRVTVDDGKPFRLHPPGSIETEWASFNLGEFVFGPGSALSLLPFVIVVGGGVWLLTRRAGRPEVAAPVAETVG